MDIALMNRTITVQKSTGSTDQIGNHINTWANYYTCHTTVNGESGGEEAAAGTTTDHSEIAFTIRWCAAVDVITPEKYRVVFNGDIFNIIGVDHKNYKHRSVKLCCRKERD